MSIQYGQFCPIAKAAELVCERWTMLILQELVQESTRFNDFQRALPDISPALLTKRLQQLEDDGLLMKKQLEPRKTEYHPTAAARELEPVIRKFCPVARKSKLICERWTILILRELLLGTTRFNDFQRALSRISPTLLTRRLQQLEQEGLLIKKQPEPRKTEYHPTAAARKLAPIIMALGEWGMKWARGQMSDEELDVEMLMYDFQRRIDRETLPSGQVVLKFHFPELDEFSLWWIVVEPDDSRELCIWNPGLEVDLHISSCVRSLAEVWAGDCTISQAVKEQRVKVAGKPVLSKTISSWFPKGLLAGIPRAQA